LRRVVGQPALYCSRRCSIGHRHAELRAKLLAEAGGCGSPTCRNPDCDVKHGQCHWPGCQESAGRPKNSQSRFRWVIGEPAIYCGLHSPVRAAGFQAELYNLGLAPISTAAKLIYRSRESVRLGLEGLELQRCDFGAFVRFGVNARKVVALSPDK
jgi:hypothetical protein